MTGTFIASTSKESVHALAFQGIMVYNCFSQISDMLRRKFGDEYVLLFAKPVENPANGVIDWYSPVQGEPHQMDSLPEAERTAACAQARAMADNIMLYAEELIKSPDPLKVTRGNVLKLALSYPDASYLYAVGQQPVFICWGFGPGTPGVEPQILSRLTAPKAAPAPQPEQVAPQETVVPPAATVAPAIAAAPRSWAWLWWLFPFLAAILLLLVLCTSFGSEPSLSGVDLFHGPQLPFVKDDDSADRIAALEREIAELNGKLRDHAAMCKPAPVAEAPRPKAAPKQELVIPPKAEDTSFLEGRWLCKTGLANSRTGEPVQFAFSFGRDGQGDGVVYEKNDQCAGLSRAHLRNGVLQIDLDQQKCQKQNNRYGPIRVICQNAHGQNTECTGFNEDGTQWTATFRKIK